MGYPYFQILLTFCLFWTLLVVYVVSKWDVYDAPSWALWAVRTWIGAWILGLVATILWAVRP